MTAPFYYIKPGLRISVSGHGEFLKYVMERKIKWLWWYKWVRVKSVWTYHAIHKDFDHMLWYMKYMYSKIEEDNGPVPFWDKIKTKENV